MKSDRVVIFAVLFLAAGFGSIFAFCNGSTSFSFGYPISGTKVAADITTVGMPALVGVALAGVGLLLLLIAFTVAMVSQFTSRDERHVMDLPAKRQEPFEE